MINKGSQGSTLKISKKRREGNKFWDMDIILPSEIKLNIFSRLPAISVLNCRRVCKSWRNLLQFHHDTHFAYLHLRYNHGLITKQQQNQSPNKNYDDISRRNGTMSFLIFDRQRIMHYGEYHEEDQIFFHTTRINLNFPVDVSEFLVSSSNGLICLLPSTDRNSMTYYSECPGRVDPLYVCNPITREIVTVPGLYLHENNEKGIKLLHGFGYHPLTNEYKVVRICYHSRRKYEHDFLQGHVEVYTLGSGKGWRNIGQIDYYIVPNDNDTTGNNCVNGSLHWLKYETGEIAAFDLAHEEFHLVVKPSGLSSKRQLSSRIFVMNGCLCLACEYRDNGVDLWMLKKNDEEKNAGIGNLLDHEKDQYYKSWSWSKEFRITPKKNRFGEIVGLTKRDKLLFARFSGSMTRYNPRTRTAKKIRTHHPNDNCLIHARIIPHANSFVSLKALGEVNVETCMGATKHDDDKYRYY